MGRIRIVLILGCARSGIWANLSEPENTTSQIDRPIKTADLAANHNHTRKASASPCPHLYRLRQRCHGRAPRRVICSWSGLLPSPTTTHRPAPVEQTSGSLSVLRTLGSEWLRVFTGAVDIMVMFRGGACDVRTGKAGASQQRIDQGRLDLVVSVNEPD